MVLSIILIVCTMILNIYTSYLLFTIRATRLSATSDIAVKSIKPLCEYFADVCPFLQG